MTTPAPEVKYPDITVSLKRTNRDEAKAMTRLFRRGRTALIRAGLAGVTKAYAAKMLESGSWEESAAILARWVTVTD